MDIVELCSKIRVMVEELINEINDCNNKGRWVNKRDLMVRRAEGKVMTDILATAFSGNQEKMTMVMQLMDNLSTALEDAQVRHDAKFKKTDNAQVD
jgi:hypothetical protein